MKINNHIVKTLGLLFSAGYTTEKQILSISLVDISDIPNISIRDIRIISGLQSAIRERKVIEFFAESDETSDETDSDSAQNFENFD